MLLHTVKKKIIAVVLILLLLACTVLIIVTNRKENSDVNCAVASGVNTKTKVFAVCALADRETGVQDLKMFISVCEGFGIKPTIFFEKRFIESENMFFENNKKEYECGMVISDSFNNFSMSKASSMLQKENRNFFKNTGIFPRFCTFEGGNSPQKNISAALAENGQIFIMKTNELKNIKSGTIIPGSIIYIGKITDKSAFETAEFFSETQKSEMKCLSVSLLLNTFGE